MSGTDNIKQAFELEGDPDKISTYYDKWSLKYDQDVADENYKGPQHLAQLADQARQRSTSLSRTKANVLDAGCGTGLVGVVMRSLGYELLTGFDLSAEMIDQASKTKAYRSLHSGVNLNQPLADQVGADRYDIVMCCGVFTLGHVPPESLIHLIDACTSGGIVVTSAREQYCQKFAFEALLETLQQSNRVNILHNEYADYVSYDKALYSVLQVA